MKRSLMNKTRRALSALMALAMLCCAAPGALAGDSDVIIFGYLAAYDAKLNPFLCVDRDMASINSLMYESLFELDANQQPQPLLAESWACNDGVWTINLRTGILFHNGIELVAQDVVNSYELLRNSASNNPYYGRVQMLKSVTATDTFTVTVESNYPGYITLYALTFPIAQRDTAYAAIPMGTGPYWCVNYTPDEMIRLEANPLWWKQQPTIEALEFHHYWDISDMLAALQAGEVEMFQTRSATAALTKKLSYANSMDYSTTAYEALIPNLSGIMGDTNLRRAVMYAIDYSTLLSNVYLDMAQQCEVPISPSSWLYESRSAVYYYSPERAMQYLYDSGWADLTGDTLLNKLEDNVLQYIDVRIIVFDDSTSKVRSNAAYMIAENLRAVGINASVEKLERSEVRSRIKDGDYELALVPLNLSEVPDLIPLLSSGGDINYNGYTTAELDQLLINCARAEDAQSMQLAYADLQAYIVDNLPIMGLCFRTGMVLSTRPLTGLSGIRETDAYNGIEFLAE